MSNYILRVEELKSQHISYIVSYWTKSSEEDLIGMGVDLAKLPPKEDIESFLKQQLSLPIKERSSYALIWLIDDEPVGHCNVDQISYGEQANMHLHFWSNANRKRGHGKLLVQLSIPHFFKQLNLNRLICEPYALNPAPNKTIAKLGFEFEKKHVCIPGSLCFEQKVNKWVLTKNKYNKLYC